MSVISINPDKVQPVIKSPIEHFAEYGYDLLSLLTLSDMERRIIAASGELPPKSAAVRAWIDSAQVAYAAQIELPPAPHTLPEVLAEILPILNSMTP